jgi:hypothetical protein
MFPYILYLYLIFSRYFTHKSFSTFPEMTVLTVGVVATILTAGAAAPAVALITTGAGGGAVAGGAVGVVTTAAAGAGATAATVAGTAAAGGVMGAVSGAIAGGTVGAAATGAATGAATAAAVSSASAGAASLGTAAGILSGPVGWLVLGVSKEEQSSGVYTFDCWKPVLHDDSREPSNGRLLRDVACDPRIKQVTTMNSDSDLPNLVLQNVWDEEFRIEYVYLPDGQLTTHAIKI